MSSATAVSTGASAGVSLAKDCWLSGIGVGVGVGTASAVTWTVPFIVSGCTRQMNA